MKHIKLFEAFVNETEFIDAICAHLSIALNESIDSWTIRRSVNLMLKSSDSHTYVGKLKESDALEAAIQLANLCLEFAENGQMDEAMNLDADHWKQVIEELQKKKQHSIVEGITSETDKVANEFKKELVDMKNHFGSRLKDNAIYWGGYKKIMKASEGSEGLEPSKDGIIPMYLYWMSKYRADKSGKYTKLTMEIEKKGIKLEPMSDERDGTDNWKITIS